MGRYILRRLLIAIPILFAITLIVFSLQQLSPGDPLNAYLPPDFPLPEAQKEAIGFGAHGRIEHVLREIIGRVAQRGAFGL